MSNFVCFLREKTPRRMNADDGISSAHVSETAMPCH